MHGKLKDGKIIFFITFFLYSGYYAGLALILSSGFVDLSRYYSVPLRLLLCILMLYIIKKNFSGLNIPKNKSIFFLFFLFSAFYIIKILYSEIIAVNSEAYSRSWYEFIFYFISFCVLPFITYSLLDFKKYYKVTIDALVFSGFVLGLLSLYLYKDILASGLGRISLTKYQNPDMETLSPLALSYAGALTIILCIYKLIFRKTAVTKNTIYLYVTIVLSAIMFFLGASRGSVFVLVACVPFFVINSSLKQKRVFIMLMIVLIPAIVWGAIAAGSVVFSRTADISSDISSGASSAVRLDIWNNAWIEFADNPILGGVIEVNSTHTHNIFLEVLMATGIIGFIMFIYLCAISFKRGLITTKTEKYFLISVLVFVNGIIQYTFSGAIWGAILLFAPMGMMISQPLKNARVQ